MAAKISTVRCPGVSCGSRCGGETVEVRTAKTVRVAACSSLVEQGWRGWHQAAYSPATFAAEHARDVRTAAEIAALRASA